MPVRTKLSLWAILLLPVLFSCTAFILYVTIEMLLTESFKKEALLFTGIFAMFMWLLIIEFYTKAILVIISGNTIYISRTLGLFSEKEHDISDFDGFYTILMPSKTGTYEYLFLIKDNKRYCSLSEFYHSNYNELKRNIASKLKDLDLGPIKFNFLKELINAFKL